MVRIGQTTVSFAEFRAYWRVASSGAWAWTKRNVPAIGGVAVINGLITTVIAAVRINAGDANATDWAVSLLIGAAIAVLTSILVFFFAMLTVPVATHKETTSRLKRLTVDEVGRIMLLQTVTHHISFGEALFDKEMFKIMDERMPAVRARVFDSWVRMTYEALEEDSIHMALAFGAPLAPIQPGLVNMDLKTRMMRLKQILAQLESASPDVFEAMNKPAETRNR